MRGFFCAPAPCLTLFRSVKPLSIRFTAKQCEAYLQRHVVDPVKAGRIPFGTTEDFLNRLDEATLEFGERYDNAADKIRALHSNYTLQNEILLQYMLSDTPDIIYFAEKNN